MTRRAGAFTSAVTATGAALLLAGCGLAGHTGHTAAPGTGTAPAPSASELAHMRHLVDGADAAAAQAEADTAADK